MIGRDHCIQHIRSNYDYGTGTASVLQSLLRDFDFDFLPPDRRQILPEEKEQATEPEIKQAQENRKLNTPGAPKGKQSVHKIMAKHGRTQRFLKTRLQMTP